MKETDRRAKNQMRMVARSLEAVAHHYVNPDAAHFEEPSSLRSEKKELERRFIADRDLLTDRP